MKKMFVNYDRFLNVFNPKDYIFVKDIKKSEQENYLDFYKDKINFGNLTDDDVLLREIYRITEGHKILILFVRKHKYYNEIGHYGTVGSEIIDCLESKKNIILELSEKKEMIKRIFLMEIQMEV